MNQWHFCRSIFNRSIGYIFSSILFLHSFAAAQMTTLNQTLSQPDQNVSYFSSACIQPFEATENLNRLTIFSRYVTPVLFGVYFIIGFMGNLFVIIAILGNAQMRNTTNILVFSLAVADMTLILICIPSTSAVYLTGTWPLGEFMCRIFTYSTYVSVYCMVYTLLLMSLDRFLAVVYPMKFVTIRTTVNMVKAVVLTWIIVMSSNIPLLLNSKIVHGSAEGGDSHCVTRYCTYGWLVQLDPLTGVARDNYSRAQLYFTLFFIFGFVIPFAFISVLYLIVIFRLRCRKTPNIKPSAESQRSRRRVTRMVITVVVAFVISWLPIQLLFLHQYYAGDPNTDWYRMIQIACSCLAYGHSCVNPILYAFLSVAFRKAFITLFRGRRTVALTTRHINNIDNTTDIQARQRMMSTRYSQQPTELIKAGPDNVADAVQRASFVG